MTNEEVLLIIEKARFDKLTRFYLEGENLISLPPEIGELTNLKELHLDGNPLTSPPPEVIKQRTEAILLLCRNNYEKEVLKYVVIQCIYGFADCQSA